MEAAITNIVNEVMNMAVKKDPFSDWQKRVELRGVLAQKFKVQHIYPYSFITIRNIVDEILNIVDIKEVQPQCEYATPKKETIEKIVRMHIAAMNTQSITFSNAPAGPGTFSITKKDQDDQGYKNFRFSWSHDESHEMSIPFRNAEDRARFVQFLAEQLKD